MNRIAQLGAAGRQATAVRAWWVALLAAICFEGLGRKFLPGVPAPVFYYLKDGVLLAGLVGFGLGRDVKQATRGLFGVFTGVFALAIGWTAFQIFNPAQTSLVLALIGFRAYWLWWVAPLVVASALRVPEDRAFAMKALAAVALVVGIFAFVQFGSPAGAQINQYALFRGEQVLEVATVSTTGRARVSSTFSYLVGFTNFVVIVPVLLFAGGIRERGKRATSIGLVAAAVVIASAFTSGSRFPIVLAGGALFVVAWKAGFLKTRGGRRTLAGTALALVVAAVAFPDAVEGVTVRFSGEDTSRRFEESFSMLPPVAMALYEYPLLGEGTGTQQNARGFFGVTSSYLTESEASRLLVELGAAGYLLVWVLKLGIATALFRIAKVFKRAGNGAMQGVAWSYAVFVMIGNLYFDHVWQALLMVALGLLLREALDQHSQARAP